MIHDVDEALRLLLKRDVKAAGDVDIAFDAPSTEWAGRRSGPAINLYLYDIREDLARRTVMYERQHSADDPRITTARQAPSRFFKLSYLLTAWTQRPEDEHRLLSECLGCFLRYELLPTEVLPAGLLPAANRCLVAVAQPPPGDRSVSDIWSALGGELKPSLDVRITAPFVVERLLPAGPPVEEELTMTVTTADGVRERPARLGAREDAAEAADHEPVAPAAEHVHGEGAVVPAGAQPGRWFGVREMPRTP